MENKINLNGCKLMSYIDNGYAKVIMSNHGILWSQRSNQCPAMIIYSCLLISQDASAAEDSSKMNMENDVLLPGINDIMPKRK